MSENAHGSGAQARATLVLLTLAAGQFLMTLDTSVMNVAIATVAEDVGTDVTGIQTAITLYTLVMATLMITGGKVGALIGRKRAFAIGCVIYGTGSFVTAIAPVAAGAAHRVVVSRGRRRGADPPGDRRARRGQLRARGPAARLWPGDGGGRGRRRGRPADRRAVHDLSELAAGVRRRGADRARDPRARHGASRTNRPGSDPRSTWSGVVLSAAGLGLAVFGVLRSSVWGWVAPKPDAPELFGVSATLWLILGGLFLVWLFFAWESRLEERGAEPLVRPSMLRNKQMVGGLRMFFFQYFVQSGVFFVVPLFLSVSLGLSAIDTGVRLLPLSITLLIAAAGIPRFRPDANPRRVVRLSLLAMFAGHRRAARRHRRRRLGRDRRRAAAAARAGDRRPRLPARQRDRVGGARRAQPRGRRAAEHSHQHRRIARNRTRRVGSDRQSHRDARWPASSRTRPSRPRSASKPTCGWPAGSRSSPTPTSNPRSTMPACAGEAASAIVDENSKARLSALRGALAVVAIVAALALLFSGGIPTRQPGSAAADAVRGPPPVSGSAT